MIADIIFLLTLCFLIREVIYDCLKMAQANLKKKITLSGPTVSQAERGEVETSELSNFTTATSSVTATRPTQVLPKREILLWEPLDNHGADFNHTKFERRFYALTIFRRQFGEPHPRTTIYCEIAQHIHVAGDRYCNTDDGLKLYINEFKWLVEKFDPSDKQEQIFVSFKDRNTQVVTRRVLAVPGMFDGVWTFHVGRNANGPSTALTINEINMLKTGRDRWNAVFGNLQRIANERQKPLVEHGNFRQQNAEPTTGLDGIPLDGIDTETQTEDDIGEECLATLEPVSRRSKRSLLLSQTPIGRLVEHNSKDRMENEDGLPSINGQPFKKWVPGRDVCDSPGQGNPNWRAPATIIYPNEK